MSVRVMNMVFERYPNGGGEMLLALALADHAHDDGARIYPSIAQLAFKTRQSERAVQYQLRRMEESGWLQLVNDGDGGRGRHRQYRVNPVWINGEEIAPLVVRLDGGQKGANAAPIKNDAVLAPFENGADSSPFDARKGAKKDADPAPFLSQKGANGDTKGANHDKKGCKAFAPTYNHQEPSIEPSKDKPRPLTAADLMADGLSEQTAIEWIDHRKRKKAALTVRAWDDIKAEALKAGWTVEQAVVKALNRGWTGFDAKWVQEDHRPSQPAETAWQRSQRERAEQMTGGRASAKPPGRATPTVNSTSREAIDAAIELG